MGAMVTSANGVAADWKPGWIAAVGNPSTPAGNNTGRRSESKLNAKSNEMDRSVRTSAGPRIAYADGVKRGVPDHAYSVTVSTTLSMLAGTSNELLHAVSRAKPLTARAKVARERRASIRRGICQRPPKRVNPRPLL